jgi:hypothetical protein
MGRLEVRMVALHGFQEKTRVPRERSGRHSNPDM